MTIGLAAALVVLAWSTGAPANTTSISGTVLALDKTAGTITVGEVGPWRVKGGVTEVDPRVIAVTTSTEFRQVRRAAGSGPTGWVGDFVETGLRAWQVNKGDFVTVKVQREGERLIALAVQVVVALP
jgi:hypothetical protein